MKLEQFQSMVRIEYTAGEEATAVVRLPVLAASDVLLTGGLNVYWASAVLALPEPFVHTNQPIQVIEVDLIKLLKSLKMPSGTYCLRRATPMDKLLVQPAPNRVLKQEHLNLLYHQLLYIQQELCEVKFIRAEVVRDGTYNGGIVEDKQVVPDTDPEKPNTGSEEPKPKPKPEPDMDTETQAVPTAEHLQTQGYTIAYIHNGVPIIFGKAPFKTNKRNQQIDSNGYLTISNVDTQLRVTNQGTKFVSYEAAVGKKPLAAELDAAGYTKDKAGKYYAVLPRQQTTVLPSNSPNGRFEEVSKDANGYSISYAAEAETGVYKWFVNLDTAEAKPKEDPPVAKPPKEEPSLEPSAPEPVRPEPPPEHREEPAPETTDRGAKIVLVHDDTPLPHYRARNDNDYMPAYGYTRNKFGNYPAIEPITKYVAADNVSKDLKEHLPVFVDAKNSVLKWVTEEDPETMRQESHWVVDYKDTLY